MKKTNNRCSLFQSDGVTLAPVGAAHLKDMASMKAYLCQVDKALERDQKAYWDHAYGVLMTGLITSVDGEGEDDKRMLDESDLRAILSCGIPFVRLWKELLGKHVAERSVLRDADDEDDVPEIVNLPHDILSTFVEFLLFLVEMQDPRFNLMMKPRSRPEMVHRGGFGDRSRPAPMQPMAMVAWRRFIADHPSFTEDAAALRAAMGSNRHWAFVSARRVDSRGDWLVFFEGGNIARPKVPAHNHKGWLSLVEFCHAYGLEMVGTFFSYPKLTGRPIHFLPKRLLVSPSDWGVRVDIPYYYSWDMIRQQFDKDFTDLAIAIDRPSTNKKTTMVLPEQLRKAGVVIRQALHADGLNVSETRAYIEVLFRKGLSGDSSRVNGQLSVADEQAIKNAPPLSQVIGRIDKSVRLHIQSPEDRDRWAEVCRFLTTLSDATGAPRFDPFASRPLSR